MQARPVRVGCVSQTLIYRILRCDLVRQCEDWQSRSLPRFIGSQKRAAEETAAFGSRLNRSTQHRHWSPAYSVSGDGFGSRPCHPPKPLGSHHSRRSISQTCESAFFLTAMIFPGSIEFLIGLLPDAAISRN